MSRKLKILPKRNYLLFPKYIFLHLQDLLVPQYHAP